MNDETSGSNGILAACIRRAELAAPGGAASVPTAGEQAGRLLAEFLVGYRGHTRAAYLADLRDFTS